MQFSDIFQYAKTSEETYALIACEYMMQWTRTQTPYEAYMALTEGQGQPELPSLMVDNLAKLLQFDCAKAQGLTLDQARTAVEDGLAMMRSLGIAQAWGGEDYTLRA